jgi:hypothetical protein
MSYPTLRAVLRRARTAPALPPTEHRLEIRLDGSTFAVVDRDGRTFGEVIAEATAPRGFGSMPRTIEGFMDATSAALRGPAAASSEFAGDLATGRGTAVEAGGEPREVPAPLLAPIAEQVLAGDLDGREPVGEAELLGRTCAEYRFAVTGQDDGRPYRSEVRLLVWHGLVMLRDVRDATVPDLRATAEVVELRC